MCYMLNTFHVSSRIVANNRSHPFSFLKTYFGPYWRKRLPKNITHIFGHVFKILLFRVAFLVFLAVLDELWINVELSSPKASKLNGCSHYFFVFIPFSHMTFRLCELRQWLQNMYYDYMAYIGHDVQERPLSITHLLFTVLVKPLPILTSSNGNISTLLVALCEGNPPVSGGFPHKGQRHGALMFSLMCAWTNGRTSSGVAGDLGHHAVYATSQ